MASTRKNLDSNGLWTVFFRSPDYETRVIWGGEQPLVCVKDIAAGNKAPRTEHCINAFGYTVGGLQKIRAIPFSEIEEVYEKIGPSNGYKEWLEKSIDDYGNGIGRSIRNIGFIDTEWGRLSAVNYNNIAWISFRDLASMYSFPSLGTAQQRVATEDILTITQLVRIGECPGALITPQAAEKFILQRVDYQNEPRVKLRTFILQQFIPRVNEIVGLIPENEKPLVPCSTYEVGQFTFRTNEESVPMISSRVIAKEFCKQHKNVIASIRTAKNSAVLLPEDIIETTYINEQNKQQVEYLLSQKAFFAVAGGFTGEKALRLRVHIYEAFEALLHRVRNLETIVARQLAQPPAVPALPETVFSTETESVRERANRVIRNKSEDTGNYAEEWTKLFKKLKDEYGLDLQKLQKAMGLQSAIEVVDWVPRAAEIVSEVLNSMEE